MVVVGADATARWIALHLRRNAPTRPVVVVSPRQWSLASEELRPGTVAPFPGPGAVGWARGTGPLPADDPGAAAALVADYLDTLRSLDLPAPSPGGALVVAADGLGVRRLGDALRRARSAGVPAASGAGDNGAAVSWLEAEELRRSVALEGVASALLVRPAGAVDPATLDAALDRSLRRDGVRVVEVEQVLGIAPDGLRTSDGPIAASVVVWASPFPVAASGAKPVSGAMPPGWQLAYRTSVLTEPLDELAWARLGWSGGEVVRLLPTGVGARTRGRWRRGIEAQRTASGSVLLTADPVAAPRSGLAVPAATERSARRLVRAFRSRYPASSTVRFADRWQTAVALPVGPRVAPVVVDEVGVPGGVVVVGVASGPFDLPLADHLVAVRVAAMVTASDDPATI